jgi:hypothetical protein
VQSALKYAQSQRELKIAGEAVAQMTGDEMIPALQGLNDEIQKFWKENGPKMVEFLRRDFIPALQFVVGEAGKLVALGTEMSKSPVLTALLTRGVSGAAGVANQGAAGDINGLNQQLVDFFNQLSDRVFGPGGTGTGAGGGTPINGGAGQSVAPGGGTPITNYTVNAYYTQAEPQTPAEITRTLTLLNP